METDIFLVSRDSIDSYENHSLLYYGRSKDLGIVRVVVDNFKPYFFVPQGVIVPYLLQREGTDLKNPQGGRSDKIFFRNQRTLRAASQELRSQDIPVFEDDIRPEDRFLMDHFIFSALHISGDTFEKNGVFHFTNPDISPAYCFPELSILSLDIENNPWKNILYSIGLHYRHAEIEDNMVFVLSPEEKQVSKDLIYLSSEEDLLFAAFYWIKQHDPDVIAGWNVAGFDLNFLESKCQEWKVPFDIARYKKPPRVKQRRRQEFFASIPGRIVIDGPNSLRSCFMKFDSYTLESVSQEVLGTGKLISPEKNRGNEIELLFQRDKEALAKYNLRDCTLAADILKETGVLDMVLFRSILTGLSPEYVSLTTAAFDHFMLPQFHKHNLVASSVEDIVKPRRNKGAYVMSPKSGLHNNVVGLDFTSLYPSVIRTFKIDPIALAIKEVDPVRTPIGKEYSRIEHELPGRFEYLMDLRERAKKEKNLPLSRAIKILMNGFYGVMGSEDCRFFSKDLAEGIVGNANWILLESKKALEEQGYKVLYGDTDSLFVKLKEGEDMQGGNRLTDWINSYWKRRLRDEYQLESYLQIKYEKFFEKFLLPLSRGGKAESAKKRYAGLIITDKGKKVHFTGLESVRSDWTPIAKKFQHDLYLKVFEGEDYREWLREFIWNLLEGRMDHLLVYSKRLKKKLSNYKVSPPQVKAARMLGKTPSIINYVFTTSGPVPVQLEHGPIDYKHYLDKQLKPIADAILKVLGSSFDEILNCTEKNTLPQSN